jgi:cellobiose-specific phosphotransferase system component IIA
MIQIHDKIYIGTERDCTLKTLDEWAIIHACKNPCHVNAVGYKGSLPKSHPYYLILEKGKHLVLNMVDMEQELHPAFTNPIMKAAMNFIENHIENNKILIHCNQGQSRSPSIALIYLAKKGVINSVTFTIAAKEFIQLYQNYQPGRGIALYMNRNWDYLMNL